MVATVSSPRTGGLPPHYQHRYRAASGTGNGTATSSASPPPGDQDCLLVDDDLVVSLVAERLSAPDVRSGGCGRIYSVERARGLETWTCGACGGQVQRRADDTEEAVTRRLALYDEQTQPLLDWFARRDQLLQVDGVGTSEDVFTRLLAGLWPRIPADRIAQLPA
jgi:hypothetical protein